MRNKYGAIRSEYNGRTYASKAEANWARYYHEELKQGRIKALEEQPRVLLIPKPNKIEYVADFLITWANGEVEYIDVKGVETSVFKLKHKLFKHFHPDKKLTLVQ